MDRIPSVKKLLFTAIMVIGVLLIAELSLHIAAYLSPAVKRTLSREEITVSRLIPDELLGHRPDPDYPEHDRVTGFRNRDYPKQAEIVALGDSQTYGLGVARENAWPQQLAKLTGSDVYNFGFGGYGPVHSLLLLDEALVLQPKLIIEAFYSGNDIYDAYNIVYENRVLPGMRSTDETILEEIAKARETQPYLEKVNRLRRGLHRETGEEDGHGATREFIANHSKIYGIVRAVKRVYSEKKFRHNWNWNWEWIKDDLKNDDARTFVFEGRNCRTVFLPPYRLAALDLEDPRVREGLRLCLASFELMSQKSRANNSDFLVLLLPTKELVFKEAVYESGVPLPDTYLRLMENEEKVWKETKSFLIGAGIPYLDALPALRKSLSEGEQPYWLGLDSHHNERGNLVVARLVRDWLEERKY